MWLGSSCIGHAILSSRRVADECAAVSRLAIMLSCLIKAVVKYVGGFWPIGVFFAGYRSFFFVPSRQTQTKARL